MVVIVKLIILLSLFHFCNYSVLLERMMKKGSSEKIL